MIIKHQSAGEQLGWSEMSVTGVAEWARWSWKAVKVTEGTADLEGPLDWLGPCTPLWGKETSDKKAREVFHDLA